MKNWTIGQRIIFGFGILCFSLLAIAAFVLFEIKGMRQEISGVEGGVPVGMVNGDVNSMYTASNMVILSYKNRLLAGSLLRVSDPDALSRIQTEIAANSTEISKGAKWFEGILAGRKDHRVWDDYTAKRQAFIGVRTAYMKLIDTHDIAGATALYDGDLKTASQAYADSMTALIQLNQESLIRSGQNLDQSANRIFWVVLGVSSLTIALSVLIASVVIRSTTRVLTQVAASLEAGANEIAAASGVVASSSQAMAAGSSQQAASLEESTAALEEIGGMTQRNAESALSAQTFSSQTRAVAEEGAQKTGEMKASMEAIQQASDEMAQAIEEIRQSSHDVSKIIKTIDEIAFQTNILALNASVEAARAGAAGAGFAVVAEEVRGLAQRSAKAAKETARMIETSVAKSRRGVEANGKVTARIAEIVEKSGGVGESLGHIATQVRAVDGLIGGIAAASKEQSNGLEQINGAVSQMDQVTQNNAAGAEETAAAAEELSAQAQELRGAVDALVRLVTGKTPAPAKIEETFEIPMEAPAASFTLQRKPLKLGIRKLQIPPSAKNGAVRSVLACDENAFVDM